MIDKIAFLEKKVEELTKENNYLKSLLENKRKSKESIIKERLNLYRSYFRGRSDVYAHRWSKNGVKQYSPVVKKEHYFYDSVTKKRVIKNASDDTSIYEILTDKVIYAHLSKTDNLAVGLYVLVNSNYCYLAAIDFDGPKWEVESSLVATTIENYNFPYILERSQSGNGSHIWLFFENAIEAKRARQLCSSFITLTMKESSLIKMSSYDRIFPSQDAVPKKGFGNLIALPLEGIARENNNSIFVDKTFKPFDNQWEALRNTKKINEQQINMFFEQIGEDFNTGKIGSTFEKCRIEQIALNDKEITITIENGISFCIKGLEASLINQLKRAASFKNPQFHKAQRMGLSTWGKPRIICEASLEDNSTMVLPQGILNDVLSLFSQSFYKYYLIDKRIEDKNKSFLFKGELYKEQKEALKTLLDYENGVLVAYPGFGKTVVSSALIAERKVKTLIIVHTKVLLKQWHSRLTQYLGVEDIGLLEGGKNSLNGCLDIAIINSLVIEKNKDIVKNYSMVIVDEAHHAASYTYLEVLRKVKAKYLYALTATPMRYDGKHDLIYMYCGPIIHQVEFPKQKIKAKVITKYSSFRCDYHNLEIYQVYEKLSMNEKRNKQIVGEVLEQVKEMRSILLLSNRLEQLEILNTLFEEEGLKPLLVTGSQSIKTKQQLAQYLNQIKNNSTNALILSTGKYIGEGFDFPQLDTLVLASPISWKGNVVQYVGRLWREHSDKEEIRVIDFIDLKVPVLMSMFNKRLAVYKKLGFEVLQDGEKPIEKVFFTSTDFWPNFKEDLSNANKEIIINTNCNVNKILDLLGKANPSVAKIFISKVILETDNIKFISPKTDYPFITTIDSKILWYGQFNSKSQNQTFSLLRIEESTYVDDFLTFFKEEHNLQ